MTTTIVAPGTDRAGQFKFSLRKIATLLLLVTAGLVSAAPLIAMACGILPQAVTVQEIFGNNLSALPTMWFGGYVVQVGHAYLLAFTYLPSLFAHTALMRIGPLGQQTGFAVGVYLLYGAAIFAVLIAGSRRVGLIGFAGLIAIAASTTCLERGSYLGLVITYHKGAELVFVLLAVAVMQWLRNDLAPTSRNAALLGALAAAVAGVKISYVMLAGPIILAMVVSGPAAGRTTRIASFAATGATVLALTYGAFSLFEPRRFSDLIKFIVGAYMSPGLVQRSPMMLEEALHFPSLYIGMHLGLLLWVAATLLAAASAWRTGNGKIVVLLATQLIAGVALVMQFRLRTAQSTMLDIMIYATFSVAVLTSALAQNWRGAAATLILLLAATFALTFALNYPIDAYQHMRQRSDVAHQFERLRTDLGGTTTVPSVYYIDGIIQPTLFPSADLEPVVGASGYGGGFYKQKFYPWLQFRTTTEKFGAPHVAIVPEYLDTIPGDAEHRAKWPILYSPIVGFNDQLSQYIRPERSDCRVFQFPAVYSDTHLIYDTTFATRVTVCPMAN